ncbi:MAG: hypothetical protein IT290_05890 [Deltaproteobacteria bacterium]|nr:hypothetical protein [Deltaproteobacteria bacterium]
MKTTIDLDDKLFKRAKAIAAKRGVSFRALVTEALMRIAAEAPSVSNEPSWMRCFGAFKDSKDETAQIQTTIDADFSRVDVEDWK